jgi:demethoxyubiquinone hydroxylase (CLK1/Coq7/Cat5 family)
VLWAMLRRQLAKSTAAQLQCWGVRGTLRRGGRTALPGHMSMSRAASVLGRARDFACRAALPGRLRSTSAQAHRDAAPEEIQALTTAAKRQSHLFPAWLQTELKTDHAGEYGAVEIYRGALLGARLREGLGFTGEDTQRMISFCEHHMSTEQMHLNVMLQLVPEAARTKLQGVWWLSARVLGLVPALAGPRALYWTVMAVEAPCASSLSCCVPMRSSTGFFLFPFSFFPISFPSGALRQLS